MCLCKVTEVTVVILGTSWFGSEGVRVGDEVFLIETSENLWDVIRNQLAWVEKKRTSKNIKDRGSEEERNVDQFKQKPTKCFRNNKAWHCKNVLTCQHISGSEKKHRNLMSHRDMVLTCVIKSRAVWVLVVQSVQLWVLTQQETIIRQTEHRRSCSTKKKKHARLTQSSGYSRVHTPSPRPFLHYNTQLIHKHRLQLIHQLPLIIKLLSAVLTTCNPQMRHRADAWHTLLHATHHKGARYSALMWWS